MTGFGWEVEFCAGRWGSDMNGAFDQVTLGLMIDLPDSRGWTRW